MSDKKITAADVKHVAKLSRIKLTEEEIAKYTDQLESILEYIEKLDGVDTSNVDATAQVTNMSSVLRKDEVKPSLTQEEALSTTEHKEKGYFKVKAVIK